MDTLPGFVHLYSCYLHYRSKVCLQSNEHTFTVAKAAQCHAAKCPSCSQDEMPACRVGLCAMAWTLERTMLSTGHTVQR